MRKILFLTTSPTAGGNGDTLISAAMKEAQKAGAQVELVHIREKNIGFCKACYGCRETGVCVQKDDFPAILALAHEADAIVCSAPIYYNCMAAQMLTVINRLCCTFACKAYQLGPKKKVAFMLTCTGSEVEEMTRHVRNITTLPSIARTIEGEKIEVFTRCVSDDTCAKTEEYLARAREIGSWAAE